VPALVGRTKGTALEVIRLLRGIAQRRADLAAAGLAAQDGTHRVLGVDAVVALATRGTLDPHALATAMGSIATATRLPRWAPSLEQIAQTASSGYVVDVLTDLVPRLPRDARGPVRLLDVLAEESTRIGHTASSPTLRQYLESITGSNGAAAAARRILESSPSDSPRRAQGERSAGADTLAGSHEDGQCQGGPPQLQQPDQSPHLKTTAQVRSGLQTGTRTPRGTRWVLRWTLLGHYSKPVLSAALSSPAVAQSPSCGVKARPTFPARQGNC
jgi:hypothetical protein